VTGPTGTTGATGPTGPASTYALTANVVATTTNATFYPMLSNVLTGNTAHFSNAGLTYNPNSNIFVVMGNVGIGTTTPGSLLQIAGSITPSVDNSYNLGSAALRWANMYTGDLQLSNEGSAGNDIDQTTGSWTIQEGQENLYIINNKTGKKYMFVLREV
jgi:hypothetical protein